MTTVWSTSTGVPDGPHLVLVHGSLDRSAGLLKLSRRLADRYRVTRYDRRGYGRSHPSDGPFGIGDQVADLVDVIRAAEHSTRPLVIVGHSYGGNVALALAARHPDLVDGVVTYETPLSWRSWWSGSSTDADAIAWRAGPEDAAELFMRRLIGDERWERLPMSTRTARRTEGIAMVDELLDLREQAPWEPEQITVPVLAMHGAEGRDHHRLGAETIAAEIAGAELVSVQGASHPGPNTHSDETAALIDAFVRRRVVDTRERGRQPAGR